VAARQQLRGHVAQGLLDLLACDRRVITADAWAQ
jgi:hypothetical protein